MSISPTRPSLVAIQASDDDFAALHGGDPITAIELDHALQIELCNVLEHVADTLPEHHNAGTSALAVMVLRRAVPAHMVLEETKLFPMLRRRGGRIADLPIILAQLEREHATDHGYALEIADELQELVQHGMTDNPNMFGYMLRGFFTTQRRHIEWENATIIPLARRLLTAADISELSDAVMSDPETLAARRLLRKLGLPASR